jgi:hypothetical protein
VKLLRPKWLAASSLLRVNDGNEIMSINPNGAPPGYYYQAGATAYLIDPAGTYSLGGASAPTTDPAGTYSAAGASAPTPAKAGTHGGDLLRGGDSRSGGHVQQPRGQCAHPCSAGDLYSCQRGDLSRGRNCLPARYIQPGGRVRADRRPRGHVQRRRRQCANDRSRGNLYQSVCVDATISRGP